MEGDAADCEGGGEVVHGRFERVGESDGNAECQGRAALQEIGIDVRGGLLEADNVPLVMALQSLVLL